MTRTKILLVDDLAENILALRELITREIDEVDVLTSQTADEALTLLLDHEVALILLDVQMPGISGFDLARMIRGVKKYKEVPLIFVTAHQPDRAFIFEGYEMGAVDVLFKPLDPHVVRSKIKVLVQLDQQKQQLKKQMADLDRLRSEADSANIAKSQFLANMSHEIRTPLSAVLGFSEILWETDYSMVEREECIGAIRRNGNLLMRLIDDILDLSKIEARRLEFEKAEFRLRELMEDVFAAMMLKASEKSIELQWRLDEISPNKIYLSDSLRIKQVLLNLIGNAIKFTQRGRVTVELHVETNQVNAQQMEDLYFTISDTGSGMSEEQTQRLFKPFAQADASTSRQFGGTGLGLLISRQIARGLGGDVRLLSSEVDKGSRFEVHFRLEIKQQTAAELASGQDSEVKMSELPTPPKKSTPDFSQRTLLIVDDSFDNRRLLQAYLSPTNAQMEFADSGQSCLDVLQHSSPDLILMDIQMPVMDGHETTRRLRAQGFRKPILALTAHAMGEEHAACLHAGCDTVLTKPIDRRYLFQEIEKHLTHTQPTEPSPPLI